MMTSEIIKACQAKAEERMKKHPERMQAEFTGLRTGRVNLALFDGIKVNSYGTNLPLKQVAGLSITDARTIEIKPWDVSLIGEIGKAVLASNLGLTPVDDGKIIRITVPAPTEERRKELVKVVRKMAEDFRVSIRNDRREAIETIGKAKKAKELSEDDSKIAEQAIQKLTDIYIKKVDEHLTAKEKEILEV